MFYNKQHTDNQLFTNLTRVSLFILFWLLLVACTGKAPQADKPTEFIETDSAREFYTQPDDKPVYDYTSFQGIYEHESTTSGFAAVLTLTESGNDLAFTLSVAQGNCTGEISGKIVLVSHHDYYHVGFFERAECPLQFSLMVQETKIVVEEVSLCRLHESGCSFEGTYVKQKN